ncbi:MAG TPA: hypothetical protein VJ914_24470 [Pseudonocardiaceae bacterium]|nr:hypothetical protein [Pseudonocardiaceae bacterium]
MNAMLDWLPIASAVFAVPQFLPQLVRLSRTGDAAGVSWSWAALTSISNGGWIAYFALSGFWTSLVPAGSVTALAGVLAGLLSRRAGVTRRQAVITAAWAGILAIAGAIGGRVGLGTVLTASFVLQVTPSVWTAYRTERPTGIARGTWWLILGELVCWGAYGQYQSDPRLIVLGWTGVTASLLMLARAHTARNGHRRRPAPRQT